MVRARKGKKSFERCEMPYGMNWAMVKCKKGLRRVACKSSKFGTWASLQGSKSRKNITGSMNGRRGKRYPRSSNECQRAIMEQSMQHEPRTISLSNHQKRTLAMQ